MVHYAQILLADDDEDDRFLFEEALEELEVNSKISTFEDGHYLMNYLGQTSLDIPNIIFLDLNMPLKSGRECLREIKQHKNFDNSIVAIYSTSSSEDDIQSTFEEGASIYIQKPNKFSELKRTLQQVISKSWNTPDFTSFVFNAS